MIYTVRQIDHTDQAKATCRTDAGGAVTYHYKAANELDELLEPSGAKTTFTSDPNHRRTTTNYPDGVTMTTGYDASGRIATVTGTSGGTTLTSYSYDYQKNGSGPDTNLVWQSSENDQITGGASTTTSQNYDQANRLLSWTQSGGMTHSYQFQYDPNGNRVQQQVDALPIEKFSYDAANELSAATIPSTGSTATYTYDGDGQQKGNSGFSGPNPTPPLTINYNQRQQVQQISNTQQQLVPMTFTGPGESERVTNGTQSYTYSNLGLMRQSDTNGTIPNASYTRDPSGTPISERLANGTTYYFLLDGYGSVTGLVDAPTTLAGSYQYCPTGNAPNGGSQLTPTELANLLRQFGFPFDDGNLDFFQTDGIIRNSDIGRSIQPLNLSDLYALTGSGIAGAGGLALTPGERASLQQLFNTPVYEGAVVSAGGEGGAAAQGGIGGTVGQFLSNPAIQCVVGGVVLTGGAGGAAALAGLAGSLTAVEIASAGALTAAVIAAGAYEVYRGCFR